MCVQRVATEGSSRDIKGGLVVCTIKRNHGEKVEIENIDKTWEIFNDLLKIRHTRPFWKLVRKIQEKQRFRLIKKEVLSS